LPPEARTVSEREKSSYAAHLCVAWRSSQVQGPGVGEATRPFISAMPPIATGWVPRDEPKRYVPCVDGSELARLFFTFAGWSVQPCVRPVCAVHMTAGHNAFRGSGPGQKPGFDNALALVGCPDRRIGRLHYVLFSLSSFISRRCRLDLGLAARATGSL
jgi:hypothetical protein